MVIDSETVIRAPASGWLSANSERSAISPGISFSASEIWWRPALASEISAIRYWSGCELASVVEFVIVISV
jgi:hypothetical protein